MRPMNMAANMTEDVASRPHRTLSVAPPEMRVREARDMYLRENGFTTAGYAARWAKVRFLGVTFSIPNVASRRRALPFHDLHHVALGFGTDPRGETEVSAWELRHGLPGYGLFVRMIVFQGALLGLLMSPRSTIRAFRAAKVGSSLFNKPLPLEVLLEMTVGELRAHLGLPREGLAAIPPARHDLSAEELSELT